MDASHAATAARIRVASAPCSFGVDEVLVDDTWMPGPDEMLGWMSDLAFEGTELGPPGFLGDGEVLRSRLEEHRLELVGTFLPQRFTDDVAARDDRAWMRGLLGRLREGIAPEARPFAVLADGIDNPLRHRVAGRVASHPVAQLADPAWARLVANVHRSAEVAREAGFEPVVHPHAGTWLESADEIDRLASALDGSLVGLCLDTGHFRFGGADPVACLDAYRSIVRHVHVKDCRRAVIDEVASQGGGLVEMLAAGVFCPLGEGDVDLAGVAEALRRNDYRGWVVIEQDQFLGPTETRESVVAGQRRNREVLAGLGM